MTGIQGKDPQPTEATPNDQFAVSPMEVIDELKVIVGDLTVENAILKLSLRLAQKQ